MGWYPKKVDISSTVSLSEAELTMLDAVTPGTTAAGKVVTTAAGTNKVAALDITDLKVGGTSVTATAAELNYNDHGVGAAVPGTAVASKTAILGATKNLDTIATADLKLGAAGAEVSVTATAAELNYNDRAGGVGVAEASKTAVLGANKNLDEFHTAALYLGAGAGTLVGSTAAQIDAAVAGTPLVYRTQHLAAAVEAGGAVCVPAVAGKQFQVLNLCMRAYGGNAANATTIEITEETAGTVFLSHVVADMTSGTWVGQVGGTVVITGMTNGGMTSAANKALVLSATGGTGLDTCTGVDVIVCGYYTTA